MFGFGKKAESTERTLKVEGMMCSHCERHVKEVLEKVDGVTEATASHETGVVVIKCSKEVDGDVLGAAIAEAGYKLVG